MISDWLLGTTVISDWLLGKYPGQRLVVGNDGGQQLVVTVTKIGLKSQQILHQGW